MTDTSKREELIEAAERDSREREAAMDEAWGFRAETRPVQEKWNAQHWFDAGWDAAVLRRTAVQEPQAGPTAAQEPTEHFHTWSDLPCKAKECRMEPQAEPTDAEIEAALEAAESAGPLTPIRERLRAALRAAYEEGKKR